MSLGYPLHATWELRHPRSISSTSITSDKLILVQLSPWIVVRANNKRRARLESIRYVLSLFTYSGREETGVGLVPDPNIITRFHRQTPNLD